MSIHRQRLGLYIPWALFFFACIGWTVFWFAAKDAALKRLDAAIVQAKARGFDVGYARVKTSGYPLHLKLTLSEAHVQMASLPDFRFAKLPISVNLVDPSHLIVDLKDGVRWTGRDGAAHAIDPVRGAMSVHWKDGALTRVSLDLEGAPTKKVLVHIRPDARTENAWQAAVDVEGANGAEGLRAGFVIDHAGRILAAHGADPLGPWVNAGGRAKVEVLEIRTQGATMRGSGAFGLDAQRRPEGAADLKIEGDASPVPGALVPGASTVLAARDGQWRLGRLTYPARPFYVVPSPP